MNESPLRRSGLRPEGAVSACGDQRSATPAFVEVHCPHKRTDGAPCNYAILPTGFKSPEHWHIYALALEHEAQAKGQGLVKHCPSCGGLVEVIIRKAA